MSKYGKYTGGQIEAILNKVCRGDEFVLDSILHDRLKVVLERAEPKRRVAIETCMREGGSRCSISNCHAQIGDGDDICAHGHQLGQKYEVPA